ncbi:uncharacterized protein LOC144311541 isoform X2 [Canis aureus]
MGSRGWRGLTGAAQQGRSLFRPCAGTWQPMSQGRKAQEFGRSRVTMALSGEVTSQQKPGEVTPAGLRDVVRVDFGRAVELVAAVGIGHQAAGPGLRGLDWGRQLIPTAMECHWGAAGESGVPHLGTGCGIALRALRGTGDAPLTWRVTGVPISVIFQRTGSPICLRGIGFAVGWWGAGQKARRSPQVGTSRRMPALSQLRTSQGSVGQDGDTSPRSCLQDAARALPYRWNGTFLKNSRGPVLGVTDRFGHLVVLLGAWERTGESVEGSKGN